MPYKSTASFCEVSGSIYLFGSNFVSASLTGTTISLKDYTIDFSLLLKGVHPLHPAYIRCGELDADDGRTDALWRAKDPSLNDFHMNTADPRQPPKKQIDYSPQLV
ncbi:hypothetical protein PROFUN_15880 [Planoprotostelium fungivorum]|uniref:Uncharacterized protein n=1 Tax=Planoprotostelium fungivorum TaxID=1890364 RepID=A0A2P6MU82_9EUKA|nr:hypothetical protein PROFUN_15880 [Planoprotostelium fungivorum]